MGKAKSATVRTVVSYSRSFPGVWPNVPECVYASVETYAHERTWLADCHVSLPNEAREQWNTVRRFGSREEASAYAAAFVAEAERIVSAVERGEDTYMPPRVPDFATETARPAREPQEESVSTSILRLVEGLP